MSLNYAEADKLIEELALPNSHIQKIVQPDFKTLVLDLYRPSGRLSFLISIDQGAARFHAVAKRPKNEIKLQRFAQFLRSKIDGGKILEFTQPGQQRIVKMVIQNSGQIYILWIRLFNSNIILTDEKGTILDLFMRRPTQNEVSGGHFNPNFSNMAPPKTFSIRSFLNTNEPLSPQLEKYYNEQKESHLLKQSREQAKRKIAKIIQFTQDKISSLEERASIAENCEQFKQMGELITAQLYAIQKGQSSFTTENWFNDCLPITIELDAKLSPSENAEKYFKKFKKSKASSARIEEELHYFKFQLEEKSKEALWIAETQNLELLLKWLNENNSSVLAQSDKGTAKSIPGIQFQSHGFTLLVGRTAKENDELLRRHVRGNDMWMHTRDYAGGYVFIKSQPGKTIPLEVLLDAGHFAIHYSKAKSGNAADLYYTHVKHLRRAKEGPIGLVLPTHEKNIHIRVDENRLAKLLGKGDI